MMGKLNGSLLIDSDEESASASIISIVVVLPAFLAIILNITGMRFMLIDKGLRKRNQNIIFMTIAVSEIFVDIMYLLIVFWKSNGENFCFVIYIFISIGRHNVFAHLLYMCFERFCALNLSLRRLFNTLITLKIRIIFLVCSLTVSFIFFSIPMILYSNRWAVTCRIRDIFGEHTRFILNYTRTTYSIEIVSTSVMYLHISKKMNAITAPKPYRPSPPRQGPHVLNTVAQSNESGMVPPTPTTSAQKPLEVPTSTTNTWRYRTLKMMRLAIITTVAPSLPMLISQVIGFIKPDILNDVTDSIISLCNMCHAISFPLTFIVSVKKPKCCWKKLPLHIIWF